MPGSITPVAIEAIRRTRGRKDDRPGDKRPVGKLGVAEPPASSVGDGEEYGRGPRRRTDKHASKAMHAELFRTRPRPLHRYMGCGAVVYLLLDLLAQMIGNVASWNCAKALSVPG